MQPGRRRRATPTELRHAGCMLSSVIAKGSDTVPAPWTISVAAASAIIALGSLLVSWSNRRTARKALALSERQEERRAARLDVDLIEAVSWRDADPAGSRWIGVHIRAVNPTDRDGSIIAADLHVTYTTPGGTLLVVKVPNSSDVRPPMPQPLALPVPLSANGGVQGWLMFELKSGLTGGGAIDRYSVLLRDGRGISKEVEAWALKESAE
jgi:hypothetical protein